MGDRLTLRRVGVVASGISPPQRALGERNNDAVLCECVGDRATNGIDSAKSLENPRIVPEPEIEVDRMVTEFSEKRLGFWIGVRLTTVSGCLFDDPFRQFQICAVCDADFDHGTSGANVRQVGHRIVDDDLVWHVDLFPIRTCDDDGSSCDLTYLARTRCRDDLIARSEHRCALQDKTCGEILHHAPASKESDDRDDDDHHQSRNHLDADDNERPDHADHDDDPSCSATYKCRDLIGDLRELLKNPPNEPANESGEYECANHDYDGQNEVQNAQVVRADEVFNLIRSRNLLPDLHLPCHPALLSEESVALFSIGPAVAQPDSAPIHCCHHEGQHDREYHRTDDRDVPSEEELHHNKYENEDRQTLERLSLHGLSIATAVRVYTRTMDAPKIPRQGSERDTLIAFLDYHRELLIDKASGLSDEQLHTAVAPSSLTLGGLINHMAIVEDSWFTDDFAGNGIPEPWATAPWEEDRDWELTSAPDVPTNELFQRYRDAIARSDAIIAGANDLGDLSASLHREGDAWSMRWVLNHMIEETARHCGHADFIRESIDGSVGNFREDDA
jgi:hypothetical protein